jgi:hypothetical protein
MKLNTRQAAPYPAPDCLVELDIHTYVRRPHVLCGKLLDLLDSFRGTFFEGDLVQPLVKVDSVLPCDSILHTAFLVHHLRKQVLLGIVQAGDVKAQQEEGWRP